MRPRLVVAALSARMLAEAAQRDGYDAIALDAFGDADTRRVAREWHPVGTGPGPLDAQRLLAQLRAFARDRSVLGWVAGSGFDGRADLLAEGAACLPLIGTPPDRLAVLREPTSFFAMLRRLGIAHPPTRTRDDLSAETWPHLPAGRGDDAADAGPAARWLLKDLHGSGGWHIRRCDPAAPPALDGGRYLQREIAGRPMSATFVAGGGRALVVAHNRLGVQRLQRRPMVQASVVGPVPVAAEVARQVDAMLQSLVAAFGVQGLGSLDYLWVDDAPQRPVQVLELNARPVASLALHGDRVAGGLLHAHVEACRSGRLPPPALPGDDLVRGQAIVYARHAFDLGEADRAALALAPDLHDVPSTGGRFAPGDPVCSVETAGADAEAVAAHLAARRATLLEHWETVR